MAAKVALSSSLSTKLPLSTKLYSPSPLSLHTLSSPTRRAQHIKIQANLGGGEGEVKPGGKKKFITREQEPEQYWQSAGEREGENPMKTPLPYIIIFDGSTLRLKASPETRDYHWKMMDNPVELFVVVGIIRELFD